ncbi:GNAT family N-acetyltransferase [Kribbella sp. NBC_01505]|uniref:GNAT family N-acetyltransferase n=1 Tax=Kribbella sp. NBC_01505 TaxID=2903580 RepID=UPI0038699194
MLLRPATADDFDFLAAMMLEACNWTGEAWFTLEKARADDKVWRYVEGWPLAGDFGVVAEIDGVPAGACWARLVAGGYGYVADDVPELTLGVSPSFRRRGIARALLTALADTARAASYQRLSLSVDPNNPAAGLYATVGFRKVGVVQTSDTMVLEL